MTLADARRDLHAAVTAALADVEDADLALAGWVVIAEDVRADGGRTLHSLSSNATADDELPEWTEAGYLFSRLLATGAGWGRRHDDEDG